MRIPLRPASWPRIPLALPLALLLFWPDGAASAGQAGQRLLAYEEVFGAAARMPRGPDLLAELPSVIGWADDERYLEMRVDPADEERKVYSVRAADGDAIIHRDYAAIRKQLPAGLDPRDAAATTEDLSGFIFSRDNDLYHYDLMTNHFRRLTATPGPEQNPRFSPNGRWVAYTRGHNLFAYDLHEGIEYQYTTDGSDTVYNGWASWVYYEEILGRASQYAAFWWSPDSTRLAFMRFDDAPVPVFPIYHADGQHGELERQRYPKAGDPNPWVRVGVVPVTGGPVVWMDFDERADHYLAWPFWTPDSRTLMVQWMNRGQDTIRFYNCDPATGKKIRVFEEHQPSWVRFFTDVHYFQDGSFLLRSDADGWDHLYLYGADGMLARRLTAGDWAVASIARVDEAGGWIYFMARPEERTWDTRLMRVGVDGSRLQTLTTDEGTHNVRMSPGGRHFITTKSTLTAPPAMSLHRADGTQVRTLGDTRNPAMDAYAWGRAELFTIASGDGYDLPAFWVLPPDFDASRQYPVIFSVYGGPDARRVRNAWPGLDVHYWAQRGIISIGVDHRGSGHFGKQGVALMHRRLGHWEMTDLITAARWLRTRPFAAQDKVAVTGGSYGGYVTMLALTYGAEHFDYGQASASVTDWRLYDTVYTERYMDTPLENPEGYRDGSVLTWIDRYRGGLRITHGTIDDNVHMQNSMQVIDWLTANDRSFELMIYPNSRHGIRASQRAHALREAHDFWVRHLLDGRLPKVETTAAR
jgi:dipeptidyl-peptidase 4